MADDFVVATEKYGSGSLERKYRFSAENGNVERIGRKRETVSTNIKQFFKVITSFTWCGVPAKISVKICACKPFPTLACCKLES